MTTPRREPLIPRNDLAEGIVNYRRNYRGKFVYVPPTPVPASILADRAARKVERPAPVWLVQHTAPNRSQRRQARHRSGGAS